MMYLLFPKFCFAFCKISGFCLLFAFWVKSGDSSGFFLLLVLIVLSLLRMRVPILNITILIDFTASAVLFLTRDIPVLILALPLFEAMFLEYYWFSSGLLFSLFYFEPLISSIFALAALCGFLLRCWEHERYQKQLLRDTEAGKYYELEELQNSLISALAQIEHMTAVHERARISRDIHDNAGHEIVAAYISFQTVRNLLPNANPDVLDLFDSALMRLESGTDKIREAVHNLSTVSFLGVERLRNKCVNFSVCTTDFKVYGDASRVPIYVWSMLESCLNEALTNIARHSSASMATVELDVTPHIVRLRISNNGVFSDNQLYGTGLRNLQHRAAAIGGSLSVYHGDLFSIICVIPLRSHYSEDDYEITDC